MLKRPQLLIGGAVLAALGAAFGAAVLLGARDRPPARATPVGVWSARVGGRRVLLEFNGGPARGIYKQVTLPGPEGEREREFGNWTLEHGAVSLLILATDRPSPRFGVAATYELRYGQHVASTGELTDTLTLDGPGRPNLTFERSPAGTVVDGVPAQ